MHVHKLRERDSTHPLRIWVIRLKVSQTNATWLWYLIRFLKILPRSLTTYKILGKFSHHLSSILLIFPLVSVEETAQAILAILIFYGALCCHGKQFSSEQKKTFVRLWPCFCSILKIIFKSIGLGVPDYFRGTSGKIGLKLGKCQISIGLVEQFFPVYP